MIHASITSPASYPTDPQVALTNGQGSILPIEIHMANLNGTAANTVTVSFDGTNDAITLVPGGRSWIKITRCRAISRGIWVKGVSSAVCNISVFD